jgi:ComEC/Rec2-related protein
MVAGILLADILPLPLPLAFGIATISAVLGCVFLNRGGIGFCLIGLALLCTAIGQTTRLTTPAPNDISRWQNHPSLWIRGTVLSDVTEKSYQSIVLEIRVFEVYDFERHHITTGTVRVTLRGISASHYPSPGETFWLRGRIVAPPAATNPGGYDYRKSLQRRGIFSLMTVKSQADMRQTNAPVTRSLVQKVAQQIRTQMVHTTETYLSPIDSALLNGIVLSVRGEIPAEWETAFARTGTIHLLSVSGFHLTAIALLLVFAGQHLPVRKRPLHLLTIILVWLFVLASGGSTAALRAAIMATVLLMAPLLRRQAEPLHSLAFAACLILLLQPGAIYEAGFQLSFVVTGFLILWIPPLFRCLIPWEPGMSRWDILCRWVIGSLLVGLIAEAASAPLTTYHFNQWSLVGPFANIVIGLLAEITLFAGLFGLLLSGLPAPFVLPLWWCIGGLLGLLRLSVSAFSALPWAMVAVPSPPMGLLLGYYLLLGGIGLAFHRHIVQKTFFHPDFPAKNSPAAESLASPASATSHSQLPEVASSSAGHVP